MVWGLGLEAIKIMKELEAIEKDLKEADDTWDFLKYLQLHKKRTKLENRKREIDDIIAKYMKKEQEDLANMFLNN